MSARLAQLIAAAAPDGLQINLWPTERGFQANVKERAANGWTIASDPDPVAAHAAGEGCFHSRHGVGVEDAAGPAPAAVDPLAEFGL